MMIDENIVAVSCATTYRVLKQAGLLNGFSKVRKITKGFGFDRPTAAHQHWYTDIKYVNNSRIIESQRFCCFIQF